MVCISIKHLEVNMHALCLLYHNIAYVDSQLDYLCYGSWKLFCFLSTLLLSI